jgi:hypothetical protein
MKKIKKNSTTSMIFLFANKMAALNGALLMISLLKSVVLVKLLDIMNWTCTSPSYNDLTCTSVDKNSVRLNLDSLRNIPLIFLLIANKNIPVLYDFTF